MLLLGTSRKHFFLIVSCIGNISISKPYDCNIDSSSSTRTLPPLWNKYVKMSVQGYKSFETSDDSGSWPRWTTKPDRQRWAEPDASSFCCGIRISVFPCLDVLWLAFCGGMLESAILQAIAQKSSMFAEVRMDWVKKVHPQLDQGTTVNKQFYKNKPRWKIEM